MCAHLLILAHYALPISLHWEVHEMAGIHRTTSAMNDDDDDDDNNMAATAQIEKQFARSMKISVPIERPVGSKVRFH